MSLIAEIDGMGGMIKAIEEGFPQREIGRAAYEYQLSLESGDRKVVGVNDYIEEDDTGSAVFRVDPALEEAQVASLGKWRKDRDAASVTSVLERLEAASKTGDNLFPIVLDAVKAGASVGEICTTLAATFGRYRQHRTV